MREIKDLPLIWYFAKLRIMNAVFKALSDPTRRRVLQLLHEHPMTAGELADEFNLAKPTMSGHFAVLRQAGLVYTERDGTTVTYRLKLSVLEEALLRFVQAFAPDMSSSGRSALLDRLLEKGT